MSKLDILRQGLVEHNIVYKESHKESGTTLIGYFGNDVLCLKKKIIGKLTNPEGFYTIYKFRQDGSVVNMNYFTLAEMEFIKELMHD